MIVSTGVLRMLQGLSLLAGVIAAMIGAYAKLRKKPAKTVLTVAERPRLTYHAIVA